MSNLNHDEIRKREMLKQVMDNDLFKEALFDVRRQLGDEMLRVNDAAKREELFRESQVLNRVESRLTEYSNELLFLKKDEAA